MANLSLNSKLTGNKKRNCNWLINPNSFKRLWSWWKGRGNKLKKRLCSLSVWKMPRKVNLPLWMGLNLRLHWGCPRSINRKKYRGLKAWNNTWNKRPSKGRKQKKLQTLLRSRNFIWTKWLLFTDHLSEKTSNLWLIIWPSCREISWMSPFTTNASKSCSTTASSISL